MLHQIFFSSTHLSIFITAWRIVWGWNGRWPHKVIYVFAVCSKAHKTCCALSRFLYSLLTEFRITSSNQLCLIIPISIILLLNCQYVSLKAAQRWLIWWGMSLHLCSGQYNANPTWCTVKTKFHLLLEESFQCIS